MSESQKKLQGRKTKITYITGGISLFTFFFLVMYSYFYLGVFNNKNWIRKKININSPKPSPNTIIIILVIKHEQILEKVKIQVWW
jgi:hypothetical protein